MAHPIMFRDDEPALVRLREVTMLLPGAVEFVSHGRPCFKAGEKGRIFASYGAGRRTGPGEHERVDSAVVVKVDLAELAALDQDDRFFVPLYAGTSPWRALDLAGRGVDWDEVAELVDSSYRLVAGKRLLAELEDR